MSVAVELEADIHVVETGWDLPDAWRGLIDFGEMWSELDAGLWRAEWGELPLGRPLAYGCEVRRAGDGRGVVVRLIAVDERRDVMTPGAPFTLNEGGTVRASGRLR
jgi:hypothetical protein